MTILNRKSLIFTILFSMSTISFAQSTDTTMPATDTTTPASTSTETTMPATTTSTTTNTQSSDTTQAMSEKKHTIEGLWRTYDNNDQARSIVQFNKTGSSYTAKILKVIPVDGKDDKNCTQCTGDLKNKPLVGMAIVTGLVPKGKNQWDNGTVLDTDSGKTYDCSATLSEDGRTLHFYAHLGPFGATVDWKRVEKVE